MNWYDASRSVDVMDALYDYGNGELGDMVLGVSPDLSTSLPMKYRTTTLDSGTPTWAATSSPSAGTTP